MANGGFGQGFGQAWSQSLKMNREQEEKERKKDRRNMWMLQLIGAPVAKGITEGVTAAIKEPFKDPIQNYFNTSQGLDLKREVRQTKVIKDNNTSDYNKLITSPSGRGVEEFGNPEIARRVDMLDRNLKKLNAGYKGEVKDLPGYAEKVINIRDDVLKQGGWLDTNNASIKNLYKSLIDVSDLGDKRVKAAVNKFNSESSGLISQGARKIKRIFTGRTREQERDESLQSILSELGLTRSAKLPEGVYPDVSRQGTGILDMVDKAYFERKGAASTRQELIDSVSAYFKEIEDNPEVAARTKQYSSQQELITTLLTDPARQSDLNMYNEILQLQKEGTLEKVFITPEYLEDYKSSKIENLVGLPLDKTQYSQWRAYTLGQDTTFLKILREHEAFIRRLDTGKSSIGQKSATEQSEAFTENVYETARRVVNANVLANDELRAYILEDNRDISRRFMNEVDRVATIIANNHVTLTNADGQQVSFAKVGNLVSGIADTLGTEGATEKLGTALKLRPYLTIDQQGISDSGLYLKADSKINIRKIREGDIAFNPNVEGKGDQISIDTTKEKVVLYANQAGDDTVVAGFYEDRKKVLDDALEMGQETGDFQAALDYYNAETNNISASFAKTARVKNVVVVDNASTLNRIQYLKDAAKTIVPKNAAVNKDNTEVEQKMPDPIQLKYNDKVLLSMQSDPNNPVHSRSPLREFLESDDETERVANTSGLGKDTLPRTFTAPDSGFGNITNIFDPEVWKRARAGSYENYVAQKEKEEQETMVSSLLGKDTLPRTFTPPARASRKLEITLGPLVDKLINTFIPSAEATTTSTTSIDLPVVEKEAKRKGTSISKIVSKEKQTHKDRWEDRGSIEVSNVLTNNKKIKVDTKDPVKFIKDNNFSIEESVALYATAITNHNKTAPKGVSSVYQLNPIENALTWHLKANPQDKGIVESTYKSLQKMRMDDGNFSAQLDTPSIKKELESYKEKVSKMSKSEKEKEFKTQLSIAQKVNVITEQDLIDNSTEYRKLQSIFGEKNNRKIPRTKYIDRETGLMVTESTTVNDKVSQYYTEKTIDYDSISKRLDIYRNVLNNIGVSPKSLLASN